MPAAPSMPVTLPVIDLAVGLGIPATEVTAQSCVLVVELVIGGERMVVGLLADAVNRVLDLAPEDIEPSPPFGTRAPAALVLGTARVDGRFVLLLDVERLFADATFRRDASGGRPASAILQHDGERS